MGGVNSPQQPRSIGTDYEPSFGKLDGCGTGTTPEETGKEVDEEIDDQKGRPRGQSQHLAAPRTRHLDRRADGGRPASRRSPRWARSARWATRSPGPGGGLRRRSLRPAAHAARARRRSGRGRKSTSTAPLRLGDRARSGGPLRPWVTLAAGVRDFHAGVKALGHAGGWIGVARRRGPRPRAGPARCAGGAGWRCS